VINSAPFGYIKDNKDKKIGRSLLIVDKEAVWVRRIFDEYIK
jgi:hypothetical protein